MANILQFGDSWGVTTCNLPDCELTTEYYFLGRGHTVFNKSWGGCPNGMQLDFAEGFLKHSTVKVDLVIWFHTEVFRDFPCSRNNQYAMDFGPPRDLEHILDWLAEHYYAQAQRLKQLQPKAKWAIIGGHGPVRPRQRHLLEFADYIVDDWRSEIVGYKLPECHTMENVDYLWSMKDSLNLDQIQAELDKRELIRGATQDRSLFFDTVHPSIPVVHQMNLRLQERFDL